MYFTSAADFCISRVAPIYIYMRVYVLLLLLSLHQSIGLLLSICQCRPGDFSLLANGFAVKLVYGGKVIIIGCRSVETATPATPLLPQWLLPVRTASRSAMAPIRDRVVTMIFIGHHSVEHGRSIIPPAIGQPLS